MGRKWNKKLALLVGIILVWAASSTAQQAPDIILYNGKIVTMDDHGVNSNVGTIASALAIKDDTILAVGSNSRIQELAGPATRTIDLQGRMVLPGFGATHDHPMDWDTINPYIVRKVVKDEMHIERFLNVAPEEVIQQFPRVLTEAVGKAKPGQWIRITILYGPHYQWSVESFGLLGRQINKQMLDLAAPNNPMQVRWGFVGQLLNQKAIEEVVKYYGDQWQKFTWNPFQAEGTDRTGIGSTNYRWLEQDVLYPPEQLTEIYRLGLSWMAGYGVTSNSSGLYTGGAVRAYSDLHQKGLLAIRLPFSYQWRPRPDFWSDPYFPKFMAAMVGEGDKYFWLNGLWPSDNAVDCFTIPPTSPQVKTQACHFSQDWRDGENAKAMYNMVKAGGRLAGIHTGGDKDTDYILDIIEKASKDGGMTLDQIRAKRHAYDHMGGSPRPEQVARIKNLGMIVGGYNMQLWEGGAEKMFHDYGERAVEWMQPRKSLLDAGVMNSVEIDRPIGSTDLTYFHVLWIGITRKDLHGKVWAPNQAVSREAMLKFATLGGAYYTKHERVLGSLEPGKWADLIVIDRDYLTIPVDEIENIRVLMTMVGGKIVHLVPSLAKEMAMQPTGTQVELGGPASQW